LLGKLGIRFLLKMLETGRAMRLGNHLIDQALLYNRRGAE